MKPLKRGSLLYYSLLANVLQDAMHAYLVTGGANQDRERDIQKRLRDLHIAPTDTFYLTDEGEHIGIGAVREFARRMTLAPYQSPFLAGILTSAERLTVEAQNALLKILEEPPPHVVFFVETASADLLLPTVVSRLTSVVVKAAVGALTAHGAYRTTIRELLAASPGTKLALIDTIARDRITAKDWVQNALVTCRAMLIEAVNDGLMQEADTIRRLIRLLMKAQGDLALNINPKLVLDNVFLSLKGI